MTYLAERISEIKVFEAGQLASLVGLRPAVQAFAPIYIDDVLRMKHWYSDLLELVNKTNLPEEHLPLVLTAQDDYTNVVEIAELISVEAVLLEKFSNAIRPARARHGLETETDYALEYIDGKPFSEVLAKAKRNYNAISSATKDDYPPLAECERLLDELEVIELMGQASN